MPTIHAAGRDETYKNILQNTIDANGQPQRLDNDEQDRYRGDRERHHIGTGVARVTTATQTNETMALPCHDVITTTATANDGVNATVSGAAVTAPHLEEPRQRRRRMSPK